MVGRADWILTKNRIIQKTQHLLAFLQEEQYRLLQRGTLLPESLINSSAKISKGENYKGLPYLVLDYPRYFSKEDIFAMRTFFWWGNFFSATLHLSGGYKKKYEKNIVRSFDLLKANYFFVCINEEQWEHHFDADNYQPLEQCTVSAFEKLIDKKPFIKLAKKISLQQWDDAEKKLLEIFSQLIDALNA